MAIEQEESAPRSRRYVEQLPEFFVAIAYFQCGTFLAYTLYTFSFPLQIFNGILFYPQLMISVGASIAGFMLATSKRVLRHIVWIHFYLLGAGTAVLFGAGLVIVWHFDYRTGAIVGGLGFGMVYVAGMAYTFVRTRSPRHRTQRVALCHLCLATGMAASVHYFARWAHLIHLPHLFGHFIAYSAGITLLLVAGNEVLHVFDVYDYKRCLNADLCAANLRADRFDAALKPCTPDAVPVKQRDKQAGLVAVMVLAKVVNGFVYNNVLMVYTIISQAHLLQRWFGHYHIIHYCILAGIGCGIVASMMAPIKYVYVVSLGSAGSLILAASIAYCNVNGYEVAAVLFWLFYVAAGIGAFIPDTGLMEVSHVMTYELGLTMGVIVEQIPITVGITVTNRQFRAIIQSSRLLWINAGVYVGLACVVVVLIVLSYPDTYRKSIIANQRLILFGQKETADGHIQAVPTISRVSPLDPVLASDNNNPANLVYQIPDIPVESPLSHPESIIHYDNPYFMHKL